MAAGVSLDRSIEAFGSDGPTHTRHVVKALRSLGVKCADKLRVVCRSKPLYPKRCIVHICRYGITGQRTHKSHWMLHYDGTMYDPGDRWPDGYANWRITSYLEIYS